jgi:hypothetical protein
VEERGEFVRRIDLSFEYSTKTLLPSAKAFLFGSGKRACGQPINAKSFN